MIRIPFNKPHLTGKELEYIRQAHTNGWLSGDGPFTKKCQAWLEKEVGSRKALLTHSCTGALEMSALLADVGPGDEVIMPSFTFVSTATAFALRGATPVFVDIRPDTLNLDESKVEAAVTPRTKALVPVHYGGVGCDMEALGRIAERHKLVVIEDAAHSILAAYKGRPLGGLGHLATLSFHETKSLISGEGGALLINDDRFVARAEIIREKGTNRSQFFRGQVDKYTWVDLGSSYLPNEITAAFLWAQLEEAQSMIARRIAIWDRYHAALAPLEAEGRVRRPVVPPECHPTAHVYYLVMRSLDERTRLIDRLKARGILAVFHYVPLHDSPAGLRYGRASGDLPVTRSVSDRLVRLPLWLGVEPHLDEIIEAVLTEIRSFR